MRRSFTFRTALVVGITAAILIAPGAPAQPARADIPFAFAANHQQLPAGCYQVKLLSNAILGLVSCETGKTVGVMVHTANGYPAVQNGSMIFQVTVNGYRLIRVRFAGVNIQSDLSVQPKPERELVQIEGSETTEIAMK